MNNTCLLCNCLIRTRITITEILFPGEIKHPSICSNCQSKFIKYQRTECCRGCGCEETKDLCNDCRMWEKEYGWILEHRPLFHYNQAMKEYIQAYKFQGQYQLRVVFQDEIKEAIAKIPHDLLIPIPVTNHTMHTRGFNQVTAFLTPDSYDDLLYHLQEKKIAQSKKDRSSRIKTPQPFALRNSQIVKNRTILLVDDIYTTGRTLYHAAALCYSAGCKRVQSLSLAH